MPSEVTTSRVIYRRNQRDTWPLNPVSHGRNELERMALCYAASAVSGRSRKNPASEIGSCIGCEKLP